MGVNALVRKVLDDVGIKSERFNLQWASAAEAPRFVKLITGFTEQIKELGPMGQAEGLSPEEVKTRLENALNLVSDRKVRISFGKVTKTVRKERQFTNEFIENLVNEKMSGSIASGLLEANLLSVLKANKTATKTTISKALGASSDQVEKILAALDKKGKIKLSGKKWTLVTA